MGSNPICTVVQLFNYRGVDLALWLGIIDSSLYLTQYSIVKELYQGVDRIGSPHKLRHMCNMEKITIKPNR